MKLSQAEMPIQSVGILLDERFADAQNFLQQQLINEGIKPEHLRVLVFKNAIKKNETFAYPTFSHKDLSWKATFVNTEVKSFLSTRFDLLLNYYDQPKSPLLAVTYQSKAIFKVGFAAIDKKLNHFIINSPAEDQAVFMAELLKYLKILNKL